MAVRKKEDFQSDGIPEVGFSAPDEGDVEFEFVDDGQAVEEERKENEGEFADKSREEIIEEMKRLRESSSSKVQSVSEKTENLQEELAALKNGAGSASGGLTQEQVLALQQMQMQGNSQEKGESEEEFRERIKNEIYDDPVKALEGVISKKLTPEIRRLAQNNLYHSRKYLEIDPEKGDNFKKYQKEIDSVVQKMGNDAKLGDPEVYQKAYQQVMASHIDDIVSDRVKKALEEQGSSKERGDGIPSDGGSYHESGLQSPPPNGKKKQRIRITEEDRKKAPIRGMNAHDFAKLRTLREKGGRW